MGMGQKDEAPYMEGLVYLFVNARSREGATSCCPGVLLSLLLLNVQYVGWRLVIVIFVALRCDLTLCLKKVLAP